MKQVVIIGAGLGGLACGIQLQHAGYDVTIIEKNLHAGGKMMPVKLGDYSFDFGPNTITMPGVFQKVFSNAGESMEDYLELIRLDHHTKNVFRSGDTFLQSIDPHVVISQLVKLDPFGAKNYWRYIKEVNRLYQQAESGFFHRSFHSWLDYLSPGLTKAFFSVRPLETMNHFHKRFFSNPDILQVFNRYATYIGSSPYKSPATFSLIGHLEMNEGVFTVRGGNTKIADAFVQVFKKLGGTLKLDEEVNQIHVTNKTAAGVELKSGIQIKADKIIINGDFITATKKLIKEKDRPSFPDKKLSGYEPSISAFVILAGLKTYQKDIHHHHVFFPEDYKKEFQNIFVDQKLPEDPTIYISHSAYTDRGISKGSNLFILVNAPAVKMKSEKEVSQFKEMIYSRLEEEGIPIRKEIEVEKVYTPDTIAHLFHAYKGALYGVSSHKKKDAFLRPRNASKDINGLFYVGGTTHPGGGSPMVTLSGLNVAKEIIYQDKKKGTDQTKFKKSTNN
ncbi:phytoene desaturase family protein [Jeotgalibacillus campisalis]|uniref:4,4'-diaponeurosporene oxygenase n=1 Tax=Jeotgalibacillus campisalis TaxID=220754 RepID=A0A0C2VU65_9BACL|nr:phytoene desaturase family protein [Jeotgalibacillus campisalis]KIL47966.1 phytoene desaturase [Jeotgalibacillus campisalis]